MFLLELFFSKSQGGLCQFLLLSVYVSYSKIGLDFCKLNPPIVGFFFVIGARILFHIWPDCFYFRVVNTSSWFLTPFELFDFNPNWVCLVPEKILFILIFQLLFNWIFFRNELIHVIHSSLTFSFVWVLVKTRLLLNWASRRGHDQV